MEAVAQRGEVFVDFVGPDGGVGAVLEESVEVEAPGGASAAATRVTFVPFGWTVEVGGDPRDDIVDEFAAVSARLGAPPATSMPSGLGVGRVIWCLDSSL